MTFREWCFPDGARRVRGARAVSVALRSLHLAAVALLLGGHAYGAAAEALFPWLVVAVVTGAGLIVPEVLAWGLYWFALGKGVSVLVKLTLLLAIPFFWEARVPIFVASLLLAAVTSHMPARLRHYSLLHRRVMSPAEPLCRSFRSAAPPASIEASPPHPASIMGRSPRSPHRAR